MLVRSALGLLAVAILAYPADWALWRIRTALGRGEDSVQVEQLTVAELKGNKEEYYPDGNAQVPCSRSLFPEGGNSACWWLRRHSTVIQRY
jgi:hypothetical protein